MLPLGYPRKPLTVIDIERFDPGDGHAFWRVTTNWRGVTVVFHDRWGCWATDDFTADNPHLASGWLASALDDAVMGHRAS